MKIRGGGCSSFFMVRASSSTQGTLVMWAVSSTTSVPSWRARETGLPRSMSPSHRATVCTGPRWGSVSTV